MEDVENKFLLDFFPNVVFLSGLKTPVIRYFIYNEKLSIPHVF